MQRHISAVSQKIDRAAYMGEDPHGFLHHSQHGEDQTNKCRAELLTNAFAAAEQIMRDEHPHLHLQCSQRLLPTPGPEKGSVTPKKATTARRDSAGDFGQKEKPRETRKQRTVSKSSYSQEDPGITWHQRPVFKVSVERHFYTPSVQIPCKANPEHQYL